MTDEGLKIVELSTTNVMRVKSVHLQLDPEAGLVVIGGRNDQGKTTVLNSFVYALAGARTIPDEPLRRGEEHGEISLKLIGQSGAEYNVTRTFTPNDSYLTVEDANGRAYSSPQAMLDAFLGELSFDPLGFSERPASEQREMLLGAVGLSDEMAENQEKIDAAFDARRDARKEVERLEGKLAGEEVPEPPEGMDALPEAEQDRAEIMARLKAARRQREQNAALRQEAAQEKREKKQALLQEAIEAESDLEAEAEVYRDIRQCIASQQATVAELERKLKEARDVLMAREEELHDQDDVLTAARECAEIARQEAEKFDEEIEYSEAVPAPDADPDIEAIETELERVDDLNQRVRERDRIKALQADLEAASEEFDRREVTLDVLRTRREEAVRKADMPLEALSVTDRGVEFEDFPFEQLSSSKQLKVSLAVAAALNPDLRVIRVEDGSLLDEQSMAQVKAFAQVNDFHIWVERVGTDGVSVVIEDGEVAGQSE